MTASERPYVLPASHGQKRVWVHSQLGRGADYHIAAAARLRGALDSNRLQNALGRVVARHEPMRTGLELLDGDVVQLVVSELGLPLLERDLCDDVESESHLLSIMRQDAIEPFDLRRPPLVRAVLYRLGPNHHALLIAIHHAIADGWSLHVLLDELFALLRDPVAELPELEIQFGDFVEWQRERLQGERLVGLRRFWQGALADAPTRVPLPIEKRTESERTFRGRVCSARWPTALHTGVHALARRLCVTPFSVWLAGYAVLLRRITSADDLVIASPTINRERPELQGLIAFLVNVLPFRLRLNGDMTFEQAVKHAHGVILDVHEHQEIPFEMILETLGTRARPDAVPFVNAAIHVDQEAIGDFEAAGLHIEPIELELDLDKNELTAVVRDLEDALLVSFEYSGDLFEESTVQTWLDRFRTTLDALLNQVDEPLSRLAPPEPGRRIPLNARPGNAPRPIVSHRRKLTALEAKLVALWQEILACDTVGLDDDFFDLGGDSIDAVHLARLASERGIPLQARQVLERPTVAQLACVLTPLPNEPGAPGMRTQPQAPTRETPLANRPLAPSQEAMWLALHDAPDMPLVNQRCIELDGELDVSALVASFEHVVARHPALRTAFDTDAAGVPLQTALELARPQITVEDWRSGPNATSKRERLAARLERDRRKGFDLSQPPLLRVAVIRWGERHWWIAVTCHHLIMDGWSAGLLLQETALAYEALHARRKPDLPQVPGFDAFLDWLDSRSQAEAAAYWRDRLAGFCGATGPVSAPDTLFTEGHSRVTDRCEVVLEATATAALRMAARDCRASLPTLLAGAWGAVLGRWTGADDVVFQWISHGRPDDLPGADRIVGPLVAVVPERVRLPRGRSVSEWLRGIQDDHLAARRYEHVSPRILRGVLHRHCGELPQTALAIHLGVAEGEQSQTVGDLRWTVRPQPADSPFLIELGVIPGEVLRCALDFDVALLPAELADRLLADWLSLLRTLSRDPHVRLDQVLGAPTDRGAALVSVDV